MPTRITCLLAAALVAAVAAGAPAADWPNWRGPAYNGSSPETDLPSTWSRTDGVAWVAPLPGPADATPIIVGDRVFASSTDAGSDALLAMAFSAADGKRLWHMRLGTDAKAPRNTMASPSPVTDGKTVVFLYGTGEMAGVTIDGKRLWRRDLGDEFGKLSIKYGYSSSPLFHAGRVYVQMLRRPWPYPYNPGKNTAEARRRALTSFLLAVDPETGKTLWRQVRPTKAVDESFESYGTPMPIVVGDRTDIVLSGGDCVTGHDPATGEERWRWGYNPKHKNMQRVIPSVTPAAGRVFVPMPRGSSLVTLDLADSGARPAWTYDQRTTDSATPLLYGGTLYVLDSDRKDLRALDPATGKERWKVKLGGAVWRASPTGADGKIYCLSSDGEAAVLKADDGEILTRIDMGGKQTRASIAVAAGRLYIRTDTRLWCIGK